MSERDRNNIGLLPPNMHVAIAIVGFRNPDEVADCLAALAQSVYEDFEVVICENGGSEAFAQLTAVLPPQLAGGQAVTCFAASKNLGFAGGVNACLARRPDADAWWILNPDTVPAPGALAELVRKLSEGRCDAVGGVLRLPNGPIQAYGGHWSACLARATSIGSGTAASVSVDPTRIERRQNFLNGASFLIGRRFIEAVGPMREDYFLYCEEIEWCVRARALGMRLGFAPGAVVVHKGGSTTGAGEGSRLAVYLGERNKMLLTRDQFPRCLPIAVVAASLIHTVRFVRRRAWPQVGYGLQGLWDGLRDRRGPPRWLAT